MVAFETHNLTVAGSSPAPASASHFFCKIFKT